MPRDSSIWARPATGPNVNWKTQFSIFEWRVIYIGYVPSCPFRFIVFRVPPSTSIDAVCRCKREKKGQIVKCAFRGRHRRRNKLFITLTCNCEHFNRGRRNEHVSNHGKFSEYFEKRNLVFEWSGRWTIELPCLQLASDHTHTHAHTRIEHNVWH